MEGIMAECSITSLSSSKDMDSSGTVFKKHDIDPTFDFNNLSLQVPHFSDCAFGEEAAKETTLESSGKKVCNDEQKDIFKNAVSENSDDFWLCAICRDRILPEEIAQIKGCEHAYCVHDYLFEESVCLLLRASWFKPVPLETHEAVEEQDDYQYEDDMDEAYYYTSNVRLGNRRWGDSGYVRAGRKEARPVGVCATGSQNETGGSSSRSNKGKEISKEVAGRRAKRALKREAADKAAATKHQQHLQRLGRN